ncbi:sodium- and chloride-dependent transporter XTRP3B, partial [Grammomys surdaster]|uniref:sodium- and chloride-dependent transporter XTRP3B n=1 Tax=Grammomys surdaster TaxID=491861 RepID=UPI00109EE5BA
MESPSAHEISLPEDEELQPWGGSGGPPGQHPERPRSTECAQPGVVEKVRPKWGNPLEFLLVCVSYAVGLGNVWRFPYLCQMYGGGSFLVPYIVMLIVEGVPLLYLELAVGQRMRQGSIGAWRTISPYLSGVGIASLVVSFLVSVYYNVINSWALWYLFHSFQDPLPWSVCPLNSNRTGYNEECEKATSTQYFWYRKTLNISPSIQETGGVQWEPALCLTLAWLIVYLCILRGTESTGKVVYFTASMPYFVLIIYLVRGLTLHGATNGLAYMFTPKIEQLANPKAWINAATQIFFSLGLGCGGLIAFASYNEPSNDCQKHAIIVSVINSTTAIFSSIVTFSIYGFKATFNYENCLNNILTPLTDSKVISSYLPKEAISGLVCLISCAIGMVFTMEAGNYWFDIFNDFAATLSLLLIVLVEVIAVCYVYGLKRFEGDLRAMTGRTLNWYWKIMWALVSPLLIIGLFLFYLSDYILSGTLQYQAWDTTQ